MREDAPRPTFVPKTQLDENWARTFGNQAGPSEDEADDALAAALRGSGQTSAGAPTPPAPRPVGGAESKCKYDERGWCLTCGCLHMPRDVPAIHADKRTR